MALTINAIQRATIYDDVLHDLTGVGDIFICLEQGDVVAAQRLRRHYEADMRLLDDLGWKVDASREQFELTMPGHLLAYTLFRLATIAAARMHDAATEHTDDRAAEAAQDADNVTAGYEQLLEAITDHADQTRGAA